MSGAGREGWSRCALAAAVLLGVLFAWSAPAAALPSYAQQTGEPCASCHEGAFGPQLKPYGRDFKLFGYWAADGENTLPPVAFAAAASYTRTRADRTPIAGHSANDNLAFQNTILAYAGRVAGGVGAFAEVFYDGIHRKYSLSRVDLRRAFTAAPAGHDLVWGFDVNDRPGLQDLWNSTPVFEFSATTSPFAASPAASPLIDGKLASRVAGAGAFGMWDDTLYTEVALYAPLGRDFLKRAGVQTPAAADRYESGMPYWRVALQHDFNDQHYVEAGAYGLAAERFPGGVATAGRDRIRDVGLDATYQYIGGKRSFLAAHATWIRETDRLDASRQLAGTHGSDHLDTVRADAIYSYKDTWTPAVELFRTTGSNDPRFFRTGSGSPDTTGYVVELAYAPFGKKDSPGSRWANLKVNARWVGYTRFNGTSARASANDTFYVGLNLAAAPFGALVKR